jgi:asparagine synthase (glutamine-hydrolysing)
MGLNVIAGVISLDGGPVDPALLQAIAQVPEASIRAPRLWHDSVVGLAHAPAGAGADFNGEPQPLVDPESGCVVVFDGRLDNRSEVRAAIPDCEHLLTADAADAAYALAAYLAWGEAAPARLLGDFAFAVWNPKSAQLMLANDPVAMRPLYYSTWGARLSFASTIEQLLGDPELPRDIDERALLRYLYPDGVMGPKNHYRNIQLLPGGHRLRVDGPRVQLTRHWTWPEEPPEPRRTSAADVDEFRAIFVDAVRCRLRGTNAAGLTLSGGLDSGAIACVAGSLHRQGHASPIRAYSFVFDKFASCDERKYSQAAAVRHGFPHVCVQADDCWSLARFEDWRPAFTEPHFGAYDDAWYKVLDRARADGVSVMMTGDGGDFLVGGSPLYLSDWLLQGRWADLGAQLRARSARAGAPVLRSLAPAVYTLAPLAVQRRLDAHGLPSLDGWIPPRLRGRHHVHARAPMYAGRSAWWYGLRDLVHQFAFGYHNASKDRQMRRFGLEVRHPFLDVRLFRFVLGSQPDLFYRDGMTKFVLREALHDVFPPVIRERRDKANMGPLFDYGVRNRRRRFIEGLLEDSELARRGYIVAEVWKRDVRAYLERSGPAYWGFWRSFACEMWLRNLAHRLPGLD